MSYRKITVDGKLYEYVIGATHLKIKAFGLFKVSEVGNPIDGTSKYVVTPTVVAALIRKERLPLSLHCAKHDYRTTQLTYERVFRVSTGKRRQMINCPECVKEHEQAYMIQHQTN